MLVVGLDEVLPKSAADEEGLTFVRYEPCLAPTFLFLHFVDAFLRLREQGGAKVLSTYRCCTARPSCLGSFSHYTGFENVPFRLSEEFEKVSFCITKAFENVLFRI